MVAGDDDAAGPAAPPGPAGPPAAAGGAGGWDRLRRHTPARIGLARRGPAVATPAHLAFQLAHARARDAVHDPLDRDRLGRDLRPILARHGLNLLSAESRAPDRATYLTRPDLGRCLSDGAAARIGEAAPTGGTDAVLALVDGLSARAVQDHAPPLVEALLARLDGADPPWRLAPVVTVTQGRVAVGDPIAAALGAAMAVVLIGERPGLSAPDSLGIYLTWRPRPGQTTDAERNCLSNVRPAGTTPVDAARRLAWLMAEARRRGLSGIALKDGSDRPTLPTSDGAP